MIHDKEWMEYDSPLNIEGLRQALTQSRIGADLLSYPSPFPFGGDFLPYYYDWDNAAVVPTDTFENWWDGLSQDTRRNIRRAGKKGVEVRDVPFSDELVEGISSIYNETRIRQGRRFWHYGKELEQVKDENGTFAERSQFFGAYLNDELIGFLKMVRVNGTGRIMQILSSSRHTDKRPQNALIARAIQFCAESSLTHLIYCKYDYNGKRNSSLTEFKRRSGFTKHLFPNYYIPLSRTGELCLSLNLHRGLRNLIPDPVLDTAVAFRSFVCR
ncbi:MAG: GNAT family N-acetyltransferase [Verrucomicrobiae bacterium]|nr:GNAT family N-acetyltransferase [Verrucomicrobiae bacterium]